mmetsp:Transcript_13685/g.29229  ORF Transcript_13685/g.29229 Transcript_13685/m.29229 type:complete len:412 (-) Transcript_13685:368-1603(-)
MCSTTEMVRLLTIIYEYHQANAMHIFLQALTTCVERVGTYDVSFRVAETGKFNIVALLGMKEELCPSEFIHPSGCRVTTAVSGAVLNILRPCVYEILGSYGPRNLTSVPPVLVRRQRRGAFKTGNSGHEKPICTTGNLTGRWVPISIGKSCPYNVCKGSTRGLAVFQWRTHVWAPFDCQYKLFSKRDKENCVRKIGNSVMLPGDSVTAGLTTSLRSEFRGTKAARISLLKPRVHTFAQAMSKGVLGNLSSRVLIFGFGGLHELSDNPGQTILKAIHDFEDVKPLLLNLRTRGVRLVWLSASASQAPALRVTPTQPTEVHRTCVQRHDGTIKCPDGRTQCEYFAQRHDRTIKLNTELTSRMLEIGVEVIDVFALTNHGQRNWHDDNVHFYMGKSGVNYMLGQVILNMLCNPT